MTTDALDRAIRRAALDRATWETFASDAKRSLLVEAFLQACDDRTLLAGEVERLRTAVTAYVYNIEAREVAFQFRDWACVELHEEQTESLYIALRDALTATTRGECDGG